MIDTGLNRPECLDAIHQGAKELGISFEQTDFFITHFHTDHLGLIGEIATEGSRVYFNAIESDWMYNWGGWEEMLAYGALNGFPRAELEAALKQHPGNRFAPGAIPKLRILEDSDGLAIGNYTFECVFTPGHSPGHICLYERDKKLLISGDHVLGDITPNIQCWSDQHNPLKDYLANLNKVRDFDIRLILPGHRNLIAEPRKRIDELKAHHHKRLEEVVAILGDGPAHAYHVAERMQWDIDAPTWEQFPIAQKWFATGEAIAHLRCLEEGKIVSRIPGRSEIVYQLTKPKE
jgi:glyoxylase-like metal-dependent hydrolase (beta-lactamase superfamily II)